MPEAVGKRGRRAAASTVAGGMVLMAMAMAAGAAEGLHAEADQPRAYGYSVGDVVTRRIVLDVPPGLVLDPASLPTVTRGTHGLELLRLRWDRPPSGAGRYVLHLDYQVFLAPAAPRTLEMPPVVLRFTGGARPEELRIDAWPVSVSPLLPTEVSPRNGLGELRPEAPPPRIDVAGPQRLLAACGVLATLAGLWLAATYFGVPFLSRRHRPFGEAWPALRRLDGTAPDLAWPAAVKLVHGALDRHHGRVLFVDQLDAFVAAHPAFAPLRDELRRFFDCSRAAFFGGAAGASADELRWLLGLARRCRDAERGTA